MELQRHVAQVESALEELESAVADVDRAADHPLVRPLVRLGVHPGTDSLVDRKEALAEAVRALRSEVMGPHADLDRSVQDERFGPTDDWSERRLDVFRRDDWRCRNCGHTGGAMGDADLHAHHVVPVSRGGATDEENLVTLCAECHAKAHGGR